MVESDQILIYISYTLIFLIVYPFLIYPGLLFLINLFINKKVNSDPSNKKSITILTAAFNEEDVIAECVKSVFESDYPIDNIKMIVGSDGSDDRTIEILKDLKDKYSGLDYYQLERGGKNKVLDALIEKIETELVLILDADLRLKKDTISIAVSKFQDNSIGCVVPKYIIENEGNESGGFGEKIYQGFESFLREKESKINSNINAIGAAFYRSEYLKQIPNDMYCDDLYYMMLVNSSDKRVYYDTEVIVREVREKSSDLEFNRRLRLVGGGLATIFHFKGLLFKFFSLKSFFIWSHKLVRYFSPFYWLMLTVISLFISSDIGTYYQIFISTIFLLSIIGYYLEKVSIPIGLLKIPLFYSTMMISFLFGIFRWLKKEQNAMWGREGLHEL